MTMSAVKRRDLRAKLVERLDGVRAQVEQVRDELTAYADERSERWHDSEAGEAHAELVNTWDEAVDAVQAAMDALEVDQ